MRQTYRVKTKPQSLTPTTLTTIDQLPFYISTMKASVKTAIPLTEYSNKFFRQTCDRRNQTCMHSYNSQTIKIGKHRRFNTLMRKKQMLNRQTQKYVDKRDKIQMINKLDGSMIALDTCEREGKERRPRAVTQVSQFINRSKAQQEIKDLNTENSIMELQNQLVVSDTFGTSILASSPSIGYKSHTQTIGMEKSSIRDKPKISQSRGLQLFSKLYVKENSVMIEKIRQNNTKAKRTVAIEYQGQNKASIETKKIFPMDKRRKRDILKSNQQKIIRTPMKTIENNHYTASVIQSSATKDFNDEQCFESFEINGWQTTL